jgi:hypothetical protein
MIRNTHRLPKQLAAAIAVVALAVPATSAGYSYAAKDAALDAQRQQPGYVDHRSADAQDSAIDAERGISRTTLSPSPPKATQVSNSGFDWGDAGIGAGSAVGLLLVTLSGVLVVAHRRNRRAGRSGAPAVMA